MSSLWSTFTAATQPRAGIPLVIPAFEYSALDWLETSREIFEVDFELDNPFTLAFPVAPQDDWTFVLAIRLSDGTRYKLTEHPDDDLHYPMYNGEVITGAFSIEVWSTNNPAATLEEDLELVTNNTENIIGCCEDLTPTTYDGTLDTDIFAELDLDSEDAEIILTFGEPPEIMPVSTQDLSLAGRIESPAVKSYTIYLYATTAGTITSFVGSTASGSLICSIMVDGDLVSGLEDMEITTTELTATADNDGSRYVRVGETITIDVTEVTSPADFDFTLVIE